MTSDFLPLLHFVFFPSSIFGAKCRLLRSQKPLASSLSLRFCHRRFTFFQLRQRLRSFAGSRYHVPSFCQKKSSTKQRLISLALGASQIYFTIVNRLFTNFAGNTAFPFFHICLNIKLCIHFSVRNATGQWQYEPAVSRAMKSCCKQHSTQCRIKNGQRTHTHRNILSKRMKLMEESS